MQLVQKQTKEIETDHTLHYLNHIYKMKEEQEIDFEEEDFSDKEPQEEGPSFDPSDIKVLSKSDALSNIIERMEHKEIDLDTYFQRNSDLWSNKKMSRLIESILIRLPLPAFYFDASNDDNWLVIDGLQRLSSIRKFVLEKDSRQKLRLQDLEYLEELDGKSYDELPRMYKRRVNKCSVNLVLIQPGTPDEVKFSIFRRINTGGLVLNNQEIRNAMLTDEIREYLGELAKYEFLKKAIGGKNKRMADQELVLRFLAFYSLDYTKSTKSITLFFDEMIDHLKKMTVEQRETLADAFKRAVQLCWNIFDNRAFEKNKRKVASRAVRKSAVLFEVWTVALARVSEAEAKKLIRNKKQIVRNHRKAIGNQSGQEQTNTDVTYLTSISTSTHKRNHFKVRRDTVQSIINEVLNA